MEAMALKAAVFYDEIVKAQKQNCGPLAPIDREVRRPNRFLMSIDCRVGEISRRNLRLAEIRR